MVVKRNAWLACAALALTTPTVALAQTAPEADVDGSEEIVVTAQLRRESLQDVPLSVQAITAEAIADAHLSDTSQLARLAPSMQWGQGVTPSASALAIRGLASRFQTGAYIQPAVSIVVDGMPTAVAGEGLAFLNDIGQVEILNGPQGTLFGKNATAGVVSISTNAPIEGFAASSEVGYTSDGETTFRAMINGGSGGALFRLTGYYNNLDSQFENVYPGGNDNGSLERWGVRGRALFDLTPNLEWLITANYDHHFDNYGQSIPIVAGSGAPIQTRPEVWGFTPQADQEFLSNNSPQFNEVEGAGLVSQLTWHASDALAFTSITGYRTYDWGASIDVDNSPVGINIGSPISSTYGAQSYLPEASTATGFPGWFGYIFNGPDNAGDIGRYFENSYFSQELRANYSGDRITAVGGFFFQSLHREGATGDFRAISNRRLQSQGSTGCAPAAEPDPIYCLAALVPVVGTEQQDDITAAVFADVTYAWTPTISTFGGLRYTAEWLEYQHTGRTFTRTDGLFAYYPVNGAGDVFDEITGEINLAGTPYALTATESETDLSGRVGIQWEPTDNLDYYIAYNRSYVGPGSDSITASTTPGPNVNPFVRPQIGYSVEIGARQRLFDNRVTLNVSLFDQTIEDVQVSSVQQGGVTPKLLNAGDLHQRGAEVQYSVQISDDFSLDGGVAYLDAEHRGGQNRCYVQTPVDPCYLQNGAYLISLTGLRPQGSNEWRTTTNLNYDREFGALTWSGRLGWAWQSETAGNINGDPLLIIPSYGVLDASVSVGATDGGWQLSLFGNNLTDELVISNRSASDGFGARLSNTYARNYHRYYGVSLRVAY